ncbi:carbamoyl-phosphate synthase large subunit [Aquisalinus flavus]|uniref:Carbamoyl phosphate synthase large chain n=1 Tax=Aquisalinus flavus TaxID=1526572 RepID=A0A8J2Y518_9PROT|nr:carbamoyl-phosphate synthase large subunit [Aquisalinus flavus]MBD0426575.1 carbamoyl-phosphate synthase large subunit [Aquisalinus flavus]UNE47878.1 carbamoyl-phosphate synthase large subunit [Aquisalinus flavus]GGD06865.1 carbamoyl-phosphate synthase large chain [Aquisalinus flavus]
MPKRTDISSILIIGAGPIVIGQACEFDYSGVQACKALKEEGYRIILVNSNPATIMTDPELADATYIEPITPEFVEKIIAKERPDALLPTMGGQTALNCALALDASGVLEKYNVEMIGAKADVIDKAEDRERFREAMDRIGLENPRATIASSPKIKNEAGKVTGYDRVRGVAIAMEQIDEIGLPAIIRPAFTLGGTGGGVAYNREEFEHIVRAGIEASPTGQVLIDESLLGWKEFEMEVVRDKADNCIIVCSIENIDPMGVHTGDSITVAPALTLTDKEYQIMRDASIAVLREIGVETGGSNVQFAVNPENGRLVVIEMNPRVSRSSALASKATGFPIAKIAAKLAVGYTLDELDNDITGATPASFEPTIDYVVVKIPRFAFEKFPGAKPLLTTAMKSVGEAMAIGRTFQESLQKALRSLETGLCGLDPIKIEGLGGDDDVNAFRAALAAPTPERLRVTAEALRHGIPIEQVRAITSYDPWFLDQIQGIVEAEEKVAREGIPSNPESLRYLKAMGFSDKRLAQLADGTEEEVRAHRYKLGVHPVYKRIDTCAAEFAAKTPYMYSAYEPPVGGKFMSESQPTDAKKVIILGGGPNRIGQGIEFDYCCCHAAFALADIGIESIMVNCNPETVSTDYDTSDRLYFEPLTAEDVLEIVRAETENGTLAGVIVQYGGQTPLKLAEALNAAGVPILGTPVEAIDLAEDRFQFQGLVNRLGMLQPDNATASTREEALDLAEQVGYPLVTRPSYVLGGRAMEIVRGPEGLKNYLDRAEIAFNKKEPLLLDHYLQNAVEVDVDAICDGEDVFIAGVMEHIEEAGVHSGDSACSLPPYTLSKDIIAALKAQTTVLAKALGVIGLMNVQYAIQGSTIYILEVNPRASRTVPFVAKTIGYPIAAIAAKVMAGMKLSEFNLEDRELNHTAVKEVVFPFSRFPGVDTVLGPEMRSTGEVMGLDTNFDRARAKSMIAAGIRTPLEGCVFISVKDADKDLVLSAAKRLTEIGFSLMATGGTQEFLVENGLECRRVNKVLEGRPHIVDALVNGEVQMIFNTTETARSIADSRSIRTTALQNKIPCITTVAGARAAVRAIEVLQKDTLEVLPLQAYCS